MTTDKEGMSPKFGTGNLAWGEWAWPLLSPEPVRPSRHDPPCSTPETDQSHVQEVGQEPKPGSRDCRPSSSTCFLAVGSVSSGSSGWRGERPARPGPPRPVQSPVPSRFTPNRILPAIVVVVWDSLPRSAAQAA
eukprot:TCALIF_03617-PB protein Name:"Protein of unknown function" AED:0.53 eAED:1.00 QI:0/0/0/0.5/1/1/2/0/133